MTDIQVRCLTDISSISAASWNALANPRASGASYDPFLSHAFLKALEISGCATKNTGWQPCHLVLENAKGTLLGAMPVYLKAHSQGEFVFDHAWAHALHQTGKNYYPKLQATVPFTPVTGRRLLVHPEAQQNEVEIQLMESYIELCGRLNISSAHISFMPQNQWALAEKLGYLQRMGQQYHWPNQNYDSFDEFLGSLSSKKRKNLKRERRQVAEAGIEIDWITNEDLTEKHWDIFYQFYLDTSSRKWGSPYLNREFFSIIGETMPKQVLLMLCKRAGRYMAGALHFIGSDTLYGRYWGCLEDHRFLHFETCYYQAIDFAIQHNLQRVEAGAQGEHKLVRGYLPYPTFSAHWIADLSFRKAVNHFLKMEKSQVEQDIAILGSEHTPYKSTAMKER